jgi:hypothetical protein
MAGGHARHQPPEQWSEQARQPAHQPRRLGNAQKAEPQRERAEQQHHHLDCEPRHGEQAFDDGRKDGRVAAHEPAPERRQHRHSEETQPQAVEHACSFPFLWRRS